MWKAQLKVSPSFTKPKIKIKPEEKETNCKEALKKIFEFWDNYKTSWENSKHLSRWDIEKQFTIRENLDGVPEEVCCAFIKRVNKSFSPHYRNLFNKTIDNVQYYIASPAEGIEIRFHAPFDNYVIRIIVFANDMESEPASKQMIEDILAVMKRQFKEAL